MFITLIKRLHIDQTVYCKFAMIKLLSLWLTSHSVVQALSFDRSFIPHLKRGLAKKWMKTLYILLLLNGYFRWKISWRCVRLSLVLLILSMLVCYTLDDELLLMTLTEVAAANILVAYKSNALNYFRMAHGSPPQTINWQTLIHSGTLQKEL